MPHPNCPKCGLPVYDTKIDEPMPEVVCNPIRSPECWSVIATLPKAGSIESRVVKAAQARRRGEG